MPRRQCDICRRRSRNNKCNGDQPCNWCSRRDLDCTYANDAPQQPPDNPQNIIGDQAAQPVQQVADGPQGAPAVAIPLPPLPPPHPAVAQPAQPIPDPPPPNIPAIAQPPNDPPQVFPEARRDHDDLADPDPQQQPAEPIIAVRDAGDDPSSDASAGNRRKSKKKSKKRRRETPSSEDSSPSDSSDSEDDRRKKRRRKVRKLKALLAKAERELEKGKRKGKQRELESSGTVPSHRRPQYPHGKPSRHVLNPL